MKIKKIRRVSGVVFKSRKNAENNQIFRYLVDIFFRFLLEIEMKENLQNLHLKAAALGELCSVFEKKTSFFQASIANAVLFMDHRGTA